MTGVALRYSLFFFFCASFFGVLTSYAPLYFAEKGFNSFEIAILISTMSTAGTLSPFLVAKLMRNSLSPQKITISLLVLLFIFFIPVMYLTSFLPIYTFLLASSLCIYAVLVLIESSAVRDDAAQRINYGHVRLWGSIGIIASLFITGLVIDALGTKAAIVIIFILTGCLGLVGFLLRSILPTSNILDQSSMSSHEDTRHGTDKAMLCSVGLVIFLAWFSALPSGTFLALHLKELHWSASAMSAAFTIGIIAEISVFFLFNTIQRKFSVLTILRFSLFATTVRWIILLECNSQWLILTAQTLHMFFFAGFHVASMKFMHHVLPPAQRHWDQSAVMTLGPGLGFLLGSIFFGWLSQAWLGGTNLNYLFLISSLLAGGAFGMSFFLRPRRLHAA